MHTSGQRLRINQFERWTCNRVILLTYFFAVLLSILVCQCDAVLSDGRLICLWASQIEAWETDFIKELAPETNFLHMSKLDPRLHKENLNSSIKIIVYNVENSGDDGSYREIRDYIAWFKPNILIHLSDEFMGAPRKWKYGEGIEVYKDVPFVLRQYGVFPYRDYEHPRSNVMQLPLGYISGMLDHLDPSNKTYKISSTDAIRYSLSRTSEHRSLSWSFLGGVRGHKDRAAALEVFSKWPPFVHDAGLPPSQMRDVYNNSKFVLVGRGQVNLDCFRIYEAMIAGAVPIVVGPRSEIDREFDFEGDQPPLLFAEDYNIALNITMHMSNREIDTMQKNVVLWYLHRMKLTKQKLFHYSKLF